MGSQKAVADPRMRRRPIKRLLSGWRGVVVVALVWVAIFVDWLVRRPAAMDQHAATFFDAMMDADGRTMLSYAFPEEVQANGLTATKLHRVYSELVLPRLQTIKNRTAVVAEDRGTNGFAGFDAETPDGRSLGVGVSVYAHDMGVKGPVLEALYIAWVTEYLVENDVPMSLEVRNQAVLTGLRRDKPRLKQIGITHLTSFNLSTGSITMTDLEKMERGYERWVANPALRP